MRNPLDPQIAASCRHAVQQLRRPRPPRRTRRAAAGRELHARSLAADRPGRPGRDVRRASRLGSAGEREVPRSGRRSAAACRAPRVWQIMERVRGCARECAALFERVDVIVMPAAAALPWPAHEPYPTRHRRPGGRPARPRRLYRLGQRRRPARAGLAGLAVARGPADRHAADRPLWPATTCCSTWAPPTRPLRPGPTAGRRSETRSPGHLDPIASAVQALAAARASTGTRRRRRAAARRRSRLCGAGRRGAGARLVRRRGAAALEVRRHRRATRVQTHAPLPPPGVWAEPGRRTRGPGRSTSAASRPRSHCAWARDVDAALAARSMPTPPAHWSMPCACRSRLVDSRWAEALDAPPLAKLADLQSHGALVLGDWVPFVPRDWAAQALPRRHRHAAGDGTPRHAIRWPTRPSCCRPGCATPPAAAVACRPARSSPPAPGAACHWRRPATGRTSNSRASAVAASSSDQPDSITRTPP